MQLLWLACCARGNTVLQLPAALTVAQIGCSHPSAEQVAVLRCIILARHVFLSKSGKAMTPMCICQQGRQLPRSCQCIMSICQQLSSINLIYHAHSSCSRQFHTQWICWEAAC